MITVITVVMYVPVRFGIGCVLIVSATPSPVSAGHMKMKTNAQKGANYEDDLSRIYLWLG